MSKELPPYIAHVRKTGGAPQSLEAHLLGVAEITKKLASKVALGSQGELIGLLHDLGKYSNEFQVYLQSAVGLINPDEDDYVDAHGLKGKVDHSTAGAQLVWNELSKQGVMGGIAGQFLALCIASHHSGLIDCLSSNANKPVEDNFTRRAGKRDDQSHLRESMSKMDPLINKRFRELASKPSLIGGIEESIRKIARGEKSEIITRLKVGLLVRVLFSCLIDADRVDTANFEKPATARHRLNGEYTQWPLLIERLEKYLQGFTIRNPVDEIRRSISDHCLDGASVPISFTKAGQTARYTFSGTSGQWLSLGLTSVTVASGTVTLLNPNGTTLASTSITTSGGGLEPSSTLPTTGSYTIVIDPAGTNTGTITLKLMSYLSGTLNLNGAATTSTISVIGQNARYTFSGTAGQWVSLGMTAVSITSSTITLWKPDGSFLASTSVGTGGGSLDPSPALPTTGTYTVTVNPSGANTGSMTLTLSSEVTGTLTINAAATPVTINRAGQNARFTFAGTAGQQATVKMTGNTLGSVAVTLYTPSGSAQTGTTSSAASFNLSTVTLATTGTYTITINPQTTATGSLNLQVTSP